MAVLEKIRVRMGIFITVIIGLALISFIIDANTLRSVTSMFSSKNDVGKINGKAISYQDFVKKQEYYQGMYQYMYQMLTGNSTLNEQAYDQLREQTWQAFFNEYALDAQYEKCGIAVSGKELVDLTQGRYVSPILQQDPFFMDESGRFSRTQVLNFIRNIDADPSGGIARYWKYCEDRMRDAQLMEKYVSLLTQSRYMNSLQLKRAVADRNTTAEITYVMQAFGMEPDSTLKVTEANMRDYYKNHQRKFEQVTSRDIEYVAFAVMPSEEDIRLAKDAMDKLYADFETTPVADLDKFVSRNSDVPFANRYYGKGELPAEIDSFAFRATTKDILPVYEDGNTFYTARLMDTRMMPDSVRARHILIQNQDKKAGEQLADSLIGVLNTGASFGYLAQQYSADQAANKKEGDLGWFKQGTMVQAFNDTCFVIPKNKAVKVETMYGWHIVEVTDRSPETKHVKVAMIEKTVNPGKNTYQNTFTDANNLASASNNNRSQFEKAAQEKGYRIIPAYSVREGQKAIASLQNARDVSRWAYEAKPNNVSAVLTIDNTTFVVAALIEAREEGVAPYEQVRPQIEATLQREQEADKLAQKMKDMMSGASSIDAVAEKAGLMANNASDISFTGRSIAGLGFEPKLQGAVAGATENTVTGPVKGTNGVFAFAVTNRTTGSAYTAEDEKNREKYTSAQQDYYTFYDVMQKTAKVQDHRGRFF